jgi:hypothetical protein
MIIACLALFVASTGTSIAASHYLITSTKQIKPSVRAKLKGATGPRGRSVTGSIGPQGPKGVPGIAGTARAYAHVINTDTTPTLDAALTKNFTAVSRNGFSTGIYCLTPAAGIDSSSVPSAVSADYGTSTATGLAWYSGFNCPSGQFEVVTTTIGSSANVMNGVNFTVIVP